MIQFKKFMIAVSFLMTLMFGAQAMAQCFSTNTTTRFRVVDYRTVDIQASFGDIYRLEVGFCPDLRWARRIGFDHHFVCTGDDLIIMPGHPSQPADRCWIQVITRLQK